LSEIFVAKYHKVNKFSFNIVTVHYEEI